ncbi:hypothetical protein CKO31_09900 [Thiohalocapsa halophila]|uniref:Copper chaperone PCu(A)C n=1 Tax=Thiohalocapsa halophila TaxID=69359 RepID=A0ABS1CI59_9GAMM|nr:copper chaperone PCu(A)C [Thiohalocapsa halophila]MBK1631046.1 hypothetical protein [Thiohalocapsa halophila]
MPTNLRMLTVAALCCAAANLHAGDAGAIDVSDPYARAVPPGQANSAAFMVLRNTGDSDRALVAAESTAADTVELHTHTMDDGMMQMRRIERIELPAGEAVTLAPGGLHVMLIGLAEQLQPGMDVALTLIFDDGARQSITAPVRRIDAGAMGGHHAH